MGRGCYCSLRYECEQSQTMGGSLEELDEQAGALSLHQPGQWPELFAGGGGTGALPDAHAPL